MTDAALAAGYFETATGNLAYIRRGLNFDRQIVVIQPLFEERNRLRRLLAEVTRLLADMGVGSWLFDLPGTGDSDGDLADATWPAWRTATQAVVDHVSREGSDVHLLSVRGGALLDGVAARSRYRFAPAPGGNLLRDLLRTRAAAGDITATALEAELATGTSVGLAGFTVSAALAQGLRDAALASDDVPTRTAVLDGATGDISLEGPPLWRQAEPVDTPALAAALADDVLRWIDACTAR